MASERHGALRLLPPVDEVLREIDDRVGPQPRGVLVAETRRVLEGWRHAILGDEAPVTFATREEALARVAEDVCERVRRTALPNLRRVLNATGVVLHTNLGRALLSEQAREAVAEAAGRYTNLEFDLATGRRGSRYFLVEGLLAELTGAEAAMVVNNNAAAVLLALSTLARGREVIVSRGQLVEIGGSFRIPEVMEQSGARLVEVGATNKTHRRDYERAVNPETALLLHVHTSNYRIVGFTCEVSVGELAALGHQFGLPVMSDLGSGFLVDLSRFGLPYEPTVQETVRAGADLVTFSGDKLLGGPQAGIIVGRADLVERMKKNPLTRAIRIDKLTLAGLEATLRAYREPDQALRTIPTLHMLTAPYGELAKRAAALERELGELVGERALVEARDAFSQVGGGAMPTAVLPTRVVAVRPHSGTVDGLVTALRSGDPPLIGRVQDDTLLLDVRTLQDEEIAVAARLVAGALR
ncbi:MAG: L-seryl-tRNA(Sec) selenium transferase [Thermoanaerobacterales bacterium]|nr:L-seryl-tRNA(Sec) selenium transferase [Thermoanaerobacterales bacterium]